MNKYITGLSAVLVLQIIIGAGLYLNKQKTQHNGENQTLLSLKSEDIDKLIIQEEGSSTTLLKKEGQWQLPELQQLPADKAKLMALLSKLENLQRGWPIATTTSSHERFEVAESKYQRHLQLYQGETLKAELYIGTSPGFRKVHLRKAGQDAVYAAKLNTFELPTDNIEWLDKTLLATSKANRIKGADFILEKQKDSWQLLGEKQSQLDQNAVQSLVLALSQLRIIDIEQNPTNNDATGRSASTLKITQNNKVLTYTFVKTEQSSTVTRSDYPQTFSLAALEYETIAGISLKKLLLKSEDSNDNKTVDSHEHTSGLPLSQ
ncbi:MAG: DUF4340 domain-containing protein, partial [Pseudomonadales bacterium]|nr:DUF4340 domain-containing protein [Pseudomonadales bacterium]